MGGGSGSERLAPSGELSEELDSKSNRDHSAQDGQGDRKDRDNRVDRLRGHSAKGSGHSGRNGAGSSWALPPSIEHYSFTQPSERADKLANRRDNEPGRETDKENRADLGA